MEKHENLDVTENFFQVDEKRRAMQKYKQYNIPEEDLEASEAARLAPSTEKSRPWHFIIVKDPKKKLLARLPKTFMRARVTEIAHYWRTEYGYL